MTTSLRFAVALLFGIGGAQVAAAVTIQSAPFSLGYGFIGPGATGTWKTTETSGANTPTTQGDFTFSPLVTGGQFDSTGPGFPARVLTDSVGWTGVSIAYSTEAGFQADITGAFTGVLPAGTNHQIRINIDQVSIYAIAHPSFVAGDETIAFAETTAGHADASPAIGLTPTGAYTIAANYSLLSWDPTDFAEPGVTFTRTFVLTSDDLRGIDGFEISGTVELIFTAIPEPSTASLLAVAAAGILVVARRRRVSSVK